MIKLIKQLFCEHKWSTTEYEIESYYDYSGFKVRVFECECVKCGKRKRRKYW